MKLWEILKAENIGKTYKTNEDMYLMVVKDDFDIFQLLNVKQNTYEYVSVNEVITLEFEELETPITGWERLEDEHLFYYINHYAEIEEEMENRTIFEDNLEQSYNYFSTYAKAEEVAKAQELYRRMKKFYDENDGNISWNNKRLKYKIVIEHRLDGAATYTVDCNSRLEDIGVVYFSTKELAKRCIDEVIIPFIESQSKCNRKAD